MEAEGELPGSVSATLAMVLRSAHDNGFQFLDSSRMPHAYNSSSREILRRCELNFGTYLKLTQTQVPVSLLELLPQKTKGTGGDGVTGIYCLTVWEVGSSAIS